MKNLFYESIDSSDNRELIPKGFGSSHYQSIDKNARFYHVVQSTYNKENYYSSFDVAKYRQQVLHRQCIRRNIILLFMVIMPNHTHEVFYTNDWETLSEVEKTVNRCVSRFIQTKYNASHKRTFREAGKKVFDDRPIYIPVQSIVQLFYLSKYIYDNPLVMNLDLNFVVSSFWIFEHDAMKPPYISRIYELLFGTTVKEILELCRKLDKKSFMKLAMEKFSRISQQEQDEILKIDPTIPWKKREFILPES